VKLILIGNISGYMNKKLELQVKAFRLRCCLWQYTHYSRKILETNNATLIPKIL